MPDKILLVVEERIKYIHSYLEYDLVFFAKFDDIRSSHERV